jgi:hypothetical protein
LFKLYPYFDKEIIHFGDDLISDILGAKMAGIRAIRIQRKVQMKSKFRLNPITPKPLPSFVNDKKAASSLARYFSQQLNDFTKEGDKIIFLGSEGAFLSNVVRQCKEGLVFACFNGGRRFAMLACLHSQTEWVIARYLQERVSLKVIIEMLGINLENENKSRLAFDCIVNADSKIKMMLSSKQTTESKLAKMLIERDFAIDQNTNRIVLIDIGYRGTFAQSIKRLFDYEISVIQIFGNDYEMRQNKIKVITLFSEETGFNFRPSIPMIELLFAAGPRASITSPSLDLFQKQIWSSEDTYSFLHLRQEVARLIYWPSKATMHMVRGFVATDDFSSEDSQFFGTHLSIRQKLAKSHLVHYHFGKLGVISSFLIKKIKFQFSTMHSR